MALWWARLVTAHVARRRVLYCQHTHCYTSLEAVMFVKNKVPRKERRCVTLADDDRGATCSSASHAGCSSDVAAFRRNEYT